MRQVLFGLVGVIATSAACAETYSFTAVTGDSSSQTLIICTGLKTNSGRVPEGCVLSEPATAYPNHTWNGKEHKGFVCAAGHPIVFHPNGALAECVLDAEQSGDPHDWTRHLDRLAACKGFVRFDKSGRAEC